MKAKIHYVHVHRASTKQAKKALLTSAQHGWDAELRPGITPATLDENKFPFPDLAGGRLVGFKASNPHTYLLKKSNLFNMLRFASEVVECNEPMIFLEHDAVCIVDFAHFDFAEYCFLAFQYALRQRLRHLFPDYVLPMPHFGVNEFPADYPLRYYKETLYKGAIMTPGSAAFAMSPTGAKKILHAAEKNGLEQTDMIINSCNLRMQYLHPSPFCYSKKNLNLSHKLKW